jgi:hypothetical protein
MPLGAFRLNGIAKYFAPAGPTGARASSAVISDVNSTNFNFTSNSKFGSHSNEFTGTSKTIKVEVFPSDSGFYLNKTNTWTIEWRMRYPDGNNEYTFNTLFFFSMGSSWLNGLKLGDQYYNSTFQLQWMNGSTLIGDANSWSNSTWYYYRITCDGASNVTATHPSSINLSDPSFANQNHIYFGIDSQNSNATVYLDELRISNIVRTGGTPSTAFTNDENTLALFHFDNNWTDDES